MPKRRRYGYKNRKPKKEKEGEMKYYINDVRVSKRVWDKDTEFHDKYDSYPQIRKTCLNCNRIYYAIEELLDMCPFCQAPHDYDPKKVLEELIK